MIIPLSLIGIFPETHAQTVTPTITGDPFTIGEGSKTLNFYGFDRNIVDTDDSIIPRQFSGTVNFNVDSSERLILNFTSSTNLQNMVIDLDTTLGELQQSFNVDSAPPVTIVKFNYNFTGLVTQNGITNIYLGIFDDGVTTSGSVTRLGTGTAVQLIEIGGPLSRQDIWLPAQADNPIFAPMFNTTLADKNIGYIIEFSNPVSVKAGTYPISLDFSLTQIDGTPFNDITRTYHYTELTPAQETTYQNLVNAIEARQTAIDQQTIIVNYWNDSSNPFADDRELAQARIDYANSHITQSTIQRDSYQAQLDQILNP